MPGPEISEGPIWPGPGYSSLYSFHGSPDGANPYASSLDVKGTLFGSLYGTTSAGGSTNHGAVFRSSLSGKTQVIYSFKSGDDGSEPASGLTAFHGSFYGVTR